MLLLLSSLATRLSWAQAVAYPGFTVAHVASVPGAAAIAVSDAGRVYVGQDGTALVELVGSGWVTRASVAGDAILGVAVDDVGGASCGRGAGAIVVGLKNGGGRVLDADGKSPASVSVGVGRLRGVAIDTAGGLLFSSESTSDIYRSSACGAAKSVYRGAGAVTDLEVVGTTVLALSSTTLRTLRQGSTGSLSLVSSRTVPDSVSVSFDPVGDLGSVAYLGTRDGRIVRLRQDGQVDAVAGNFGGAVWGLDQGPDGCLYATSKAHNAVYRVCGAATDGDGDGVSDDVDNCKEVANADQADGDGDEIGDACDGDLDNDGVANELDVCADLADPDQVDTDGDQLGDACDEDDDGDDVPDDADLCPMTPDDQGDLDHDGAGDACDGDDDGDGVDDLDDNCELVANPDQLDLDADGWGNACDDDDDGDAVPDADDVCLAVADPDQLDTDADAQGDACDDDDDNDGWIDDEDGCPVDFDPAQLDTDEDGEGDACDADDDGDGVADEDDNCAQEPNADQLDTDADEAGDACDLDDDGDEVADDVDVCPLLADPDQEDTDGDGAGDACDEDDDGDGLADEVDTCPSVAPGDVDLLDDGCPDEICDLATWLETADLGPGNSLLAHADAACAADERGQASVAERKLEALAAEVDAQAGRHLSLEDAEALWAAIDQLLGG